MSFNSTLKVWKGPQSQPIFNPQSTVGEILFYHLELHKNRIAEISIDDGVELTFHDLKIQSIRVAMNLKKYGVKQGDVVCLMTFNHKLASSIIFGCVFSGVPFSCLDIKYNKEDLIKRLEMIKPKLLVCDEYKKEMIQDAINASRLQISLLTFDEVQDSMLKEVLGEKEFIPCLDINSESTPVFMCNTSGTTGQPKISCTSHAYFISQSLSNNLKLDLDEIILYYAPFSWISMTASLFYQTTSGATRLIMSKNIERDHLIEIVQKFKVTSFFALPTHTTWIINYLRENKIFLDSVRTFITGGYPLMDEPRNNLKKHLPNGTIVDVYASTETLLISSNFNLRPGSVGKLSPRVTVKIINENGERLGPNESGELCVKGSQPLLGYTNVKATNEAYDAEGFFHTGDICCFDWDGFLYIKGRLKDVIKNKGVGFNAVTLETFILSQTEYDQCCVVGLDNIDGNEKPAAVIVKNGKCKLTEKEVKEIVAATQPEHKHLDGGVFFVEELPYTNTGKIRRHEVKNNLKMMLAKIN